MTDDKEIKGVVVNYHYNQHKTWHLALRNVCAAFVSVAIGFFFMTMTIIKIGQLIGEFN
jgi:hypothetical protein